jgi:poly [ADP-ribose] polymerase
VQWTAFFSLQVESGFWKLTPELGFILNLNTNVSHTVFEENGIGSLGTKEKNVPWT